MKDQIVYVLLRDPDMVREFEGVYTKEGRDNYLREKGYTGPDDPTFAGYRFEEVKIK